MATANNQDQFIEGYANQLSVAAGEEVGLCVSTNSQRYSVKVTHVGCDRQIVWTRDEIHGKKYRVPDDASTHGCKWPEALSVPVGKDWPSGYYHVLLSVDGGPKSELSFVVRSGRPGRESSILLQLATNTRNAYNTWGGSVFTVARMRPPGAFRSIGQTHVLYRLTDCYCSAWDWSLKMI